MIHRLDNSKSPLWIQVEGDAGLFFFLESDINVRRNCVTCGTGGLKDRARSAAVSTRFVKPYSKARGEPPSDDPTTIESDSGEDRVLVRDLRDPWRSTAAEPV